MIIFIITVKRSSLMSSGHCEKVITQIIRSLWKCHQSCHHVTVKRLYSGHQVTVKWSSENCGKVITHVIMPRSKSHHSGHQVTVKWSLLWIWPWHVTVKRSSLRSSGNCEKVITQVMTLACHCEKVITQVIWSRRKGHHPGHQVTAQRLSPRSSGHCEKVITQVIRSLYRGHHSGHQELWKA